MFWKEKLGTNRWKLKVGQHEGLFFFSLKLSWEFSIHPKLSEIHQFSVEQKETASCDLAGIVCEVQGSIIIGWQVLSLGRHWLASFCGG